MTSPSWTEGAIADLDHIRRYVTAFDPRAARRLADRIAETASGLGSEKVCGDVAERSIVYPYLLRFTCDETGVIVIAVRHASQARIV